MPRTDCGDRMHNMNAFARPPFFRVFYYLHKNQLYCAHTHRTHKALNINITNSALKLYRMSTEQGIASNYVRIEKSSVSILPE